MQYSYQSDKIYYKRSLEKTTFEKLKNKEYIILTKKASHYSIKI